MKTIVFCSCIVLLSGCIHTDVVVLTTKTWEGHYKSIEQFKAATENMLLEKNETIWVLSNNTLKRVLKNVEK